MCSKGCVTQCTVDRRFPLDFLFASLYNNNYLLDMTKLVNLVIEK
jgi:hypothetical protein